MLQSVRKGSTLLSLAAVLLAGIANVAGFGLMVKSYTSAGDNVTTVSSVAQTKAVLPSIRG